MSNSALQNRNYLIYLTGNTISLHGLWIYRVALAWLTWQLTESEFWVGIVTFAQFTPAIVFGPIFGVLADRFDRRAASLLINVLSIMNMLLLALLTSFGNIDIYVLTIMAVMQGTLDGAHMPVRMSIVPNMVKKEQLQSAIAFSSISFNVSRFIGPAIAGIIIAGFGTAAAFIVNGISYLALIAALLVIRLGPTADRQQRQEHVWLELKKGMRYVREHQAIRDLLSIIAFTALFGRGALEMMPAFAGAVFQQGSAGLAILTSAIGAGSIVTGLALSRGTAWLTPNAIRFAAIIGGILVATLGVVQNFHLAVAIVTVLGVALSLCGVGSQILIQTLVEDEVRGRVSSIWGMVAFGGTAIGGLLVGTLASVWSLQNTVLVTGFLCSASIAWSALRARQSRHRQSQE